MINKKSKAYYILAVVGLILFITGIFLVVIFTDSEGIMKTIPFICVGIGAGVSGGSFSGIISYRKMQKNPNLAKEKEINTKDERNIFISYKAKAMAYNLTILLFAVLIMFLAVVQVEAYITLVFTGVYLLIIFLYIYFYNKYYKKM